MSLNSNEAYEEEDEVEYEPETFDLNQFKLEITTISYMPITKAIGQPKWREGN